METQKQTKNEGKVRCKLYATCQRIHCVSRKPHDAAGCTCRCEHTTFAKCVAIGPQDFMLSEDEANMQVPGAAAARNRL